MIVLAVVLCAGELATGSLAAGSLRCENLVDPVGVPPTAPRLSWVVSSAVRGDKQTAYRVLVASAPEKLAAGVGDLWDSGKKPSDETWMHIVISTSGSSRLSSMRQRQRWNKRCA